MTWYYLLIRNLFDIRLYYDDLHVKCISIYIEKISEKQSDFKENDRASIQRGNVWMGNKQHFMGRTIFCKFLCHIKFLWSNRVIFALI